MIKIKVQNKSTVNKVQSNKKTNLHDPHPHPHLHPLESVGVGDEHVMRRLDRVPPTSAPAP